MADAVASPTSTHPAAHGETHSRDHHSPVTPGKVAMWLFLATEVMFFTGLIGSYIVLRSGSSSTAYSNLYSPTTSLTELKDTYGVAFKPESANAASVEEAIKSAVPDISADELHELTAEGHEGIKLVSRLTKEKASLLHDRLHALGAEAKVEPLVTHNWPKPYDRLINPLSIDLTAFNTFVLICSSVTMVLALSAIQQGKRGKGTFYLGLTVLIGSFFLSIQIYEYYELMVGRHYPAGISATGHFRPSVSLFASCFFTMTGFHGAHVTGGVITLLIIFIQSLRGTYSPTHYNPVEFAGLYWHFVDLVWIILFTIVYLI